MEIIFGKNKEIKKNFNTKFKFKEFILEDIYKWKDFLEKFPESKHHSLDHALIHDKNQYIASNDFYSDGEIFEDFAKKTETTFRNPKYILFDSNQGTYIKKLVEDGNYEGVNKLINYLQQQMNGSSSTLNSEIVLYELFMLGLEINFITEAPTTFHKELENVKNKQSELNSLREETFKKFEQLEATYNEKLKLEAPARYWRSKYKTHSKKHTQLISLLFIYIIVMIILGFCSRDLFYDTLNTAEFFIAGTNAKINNAEINKLIIYSRIILLAFSSIFISTLFFWPIRHLVRMIISENHFKADAKYKDSLLVTYLALHKKGVVKDSEDRKIALGSIFNQPNDGLVKDDGMPSWAPSSWFTNPKP